MPYETIIYKKQGALVDITLNRPERLNAVNLQLASDMTQAITDIEVDEEEGVLIVKGFYKKNE